MTVAAPRHYAARLPSGAGVQGTTHHKRGLTLAVTQLAGHHGPADAPAASLRHVEKPLGCVANLSNTAPFTLPELRGVAQLDGPLGAGTVPILCFGRGCGL